VIDPQNVRDPELQWLVNTVHSLAQRANLPKMPEVGVYNSPDLNAFATGPTKSRSLVAVSTGLLNSMDREGIEGVLGHEIAHISNGDMVTMTLIQGVINAFVMFIARIVAFAISQAVNERARPWVEWMIIMALEIALSLLGFLVVAAFSRWREFRADFGGAQLAGRNKMIVALQQLARNYQIPVEKHESIAALQISGKEKSGLAALMSTHPPLELRIQKLREYQMV
ncbi:MAG: protease HtpX, partial [Deltaproteobacteria bacterium]|nr:protease HtpX [Deltaproteobacteria bacterium]